MRQGERIGLLIGLAGLGIAAMGLTRRTASAATRPDPYAPQGGGGPTQSPTTYPTAPAGSPVSYGTFAGPVRGNAQVWRAQRELDALGYSPGVDDGVYGADTRRALNDFQRDYGQPVTSTLTQNAIAGLEQEYARIAPAGAVGDLGGGRSRAYASRY